jgi:two-component system, NtrC family, sensor kinase
VNAPETESRVDGEVVMTTDVGGSLARRIANLNRMLAARDRTIDVLIKRLESPQQRDASAFALLEQNIALEDVVSRKTRELERERQQLRDALDELKRTQDRLLQSQKMEAIGQLAAGVAHEINTPVQYVSDNVTFLRSAFETLANLVERSMRLLTQIREGGSLTEQQLADIGDFERMTSRARLDYLRRNIPDAFDESQEGLQRVSTIVSAMKRFAHPSARDMEPVNLADLISTTSIVARNEWKYVADLDIEFEPSMPLVPCLRDEISQVVLNLLVNAAHAISDVVLQDPGSKGQIKVSTHLIDDYAEIRIKDTGAGIPESIQRSVFDPFFTTKPVGKGSGQGLSMAYATVVDKHRGRIFFETTLGKGTTFVVQLPLRQVAPS